MIALYATIFKLQLVFLKIMWVFPHMDTASGNIKLLLKPVRRIAKIYFLQTYFTRQVFCSFLNAPMCEHRSYCGFLYLHVRACCTWSFWVTEMTRIEKCWYNQSNLTNQRVHQQLVYQIKPFKEMITGTATFLSPVSSHFIFMFAFTQLPQSLEQATPQQTSA